jgi:hypothetical protein
VSRWASRDNNAGAVEEEVTSLTDQALLRLKHIAVFYTNSISYAFIPN